MEKNCDSKTYKERQKNTFFDRNGLLKPNMKYKRLSGVPEGARNALVQVQWVHNSADLLDITFRSNTDTEI